MLYHGFCGGSNPSQSVIADAERLQNWYVEAVQSQGAPTGSALYPTPGFSEWAHTPDVGGRAFCVAGGRAFCVIGPTLYELESTQTYTSRGTVAQDHRPATISYNGPVGGQLFITSGGNGYCFILGTNTLSTVLTGEATMGGCINGRFVAFNITTGRVRSSALNDGTTWPALAFLYRAGADRCQAMIVASGLIWLIGEQTGEVWYDAGTSPQPFALYAGSSFGSGTIAPFSVHTAGVADEYVIWVSASPAGAGTIMAAKGFSPTPIGNDAVETAIARYARTSHIADAETLVYSDQGHVFACVGFPAAGATWVYDFTLGAWHERGKWNSAQQQYEAWEPRVHGYAFGKHLVGSRTTGMIAEMDTTFGSELDGSAIRRLRIGPPLWARRPGRLFVDAFEAYIESGLGTASGQGVDPKAMLRCSYNGKTWGAERMVSAGRMGEYGRRIRWTRCGSSDTLWMPEVVVTDPIPWRIAGADIQGSGFEQSKAA